MRVYISNEVLKLTVSELEDEIYKFRPLLELNQLLVTTLNDSEKNKIFLSENEIKAIQDGPAIAIKRKIKEKNTLTEKRIIVLNVDYFDKLKLTDDEIKAVILHEFGHIFNNYEPKLKANPFEYVTPDWLNYEQAFKKEILLDEEKAADKFSSDIGYSDSLISVHRKYMKYNHKLESCKLDEFESRIESLNDVIPNSQSK